MPLTITDEARAERLRPARDIDPGWLGVSGEAAAMPIAHAEAGQDERAAADRTGET